MSPRTAVLRATGLLTVALMGAAATPVPHPVEVRRDAAETSGVLAWVPPVQVVTGEVGTTVAVDLGLDDGTEDRVEARLYQRSVTVDPVDGPQPGAPSDLLVLAADRVFLDPGERGVLRATATVPELATLVAIEARLEDRDDPAGPLALVLVGPDRPHQLAVSLASRDDGVAVTVDNLGAGDAIVDLAVARRGWWAGDSVARVTDLAVGRGSSRTVAVDLPAGFPGGDAVATVAARGEPVVTARLAGCWRDRAPLLLAGGAAVGVLALAAVSVVRLRSTRRRRRDRDRTDP